MKQINLLSHFDTASVKRTVVETEPNRAETSAKERNEKSLNEVKTQATFSESKIKKLKNLASDSQQLPVYCQSNLIIFNIL